MLPAPRTLCTHGCQVFPPHLVSWPWDYTAELRSQHLDRPWISYTAWFWRRRPCSIDLVPYRKCLKKGQKFGEQSVWPQNFMDFVSMCMIHIVWWTTSSSTTTESTKTMLGNLWSQQCSNKSVWQEVSRSWFYVIFECITKDCSKNKGLLTCTLFYVQPFQQTVLALLSLPFPHPFSDGLNFLVLSLIGYLSSVPE